MNTFSLWNIKKNTTQLQTDGIARREIGQRILYAQRLLNDALSLSFDIESGKVNLYEMEENLTLNSWGSFQNYLSNLCDNIYHFGPCLWNELINRRELTSQGASARNKLIVAMIENAGQPRLGIIGNGPEYSMFESVLMQNGLYVESDDGWVFSMPMDNAGIYNVWFQPLL